MVGTKSLYSITCKELPEQVPQKPVTRYAAKPPKLHTKYYFTNHYILHMIFFF